jgi:hypothetical protein
LRLTPLQLIERLAALIPPPRLHRHRYHGVLAPNVPLRAQVTALARQRPAPLPEAAPCHTPPNARRRATPDQVRGKLCGRCCWPASTRSCRYAASCAGARCASSPSSPTTRRSIPSSPTWASPPPLLHRPSTRPAAVGAARPVPLE